MGMQVATPRRHRFRLLIIGCGDVGMRVLTRLPAHVQALALTSSAERRPVLRAAGATPLLGNLDHPADLWRLSGLADAVLYLAPPPSGGRTDPRLRRLLQVLRRRSGPAVIVYASTTGVYGDAGGAWVDETRPVAPATDRAHRRVDAERQLRDGARGGWPVRTVVLRVPGIYAFDREGGDPRARVESGRPVLVAPDDVHTNHIHADDLARACLRALWLARGQRIYHVCDDGRRLTGDHYDMVADGFGMPRPPRITRTDMQAVATPMQMSFLGESRRLSNRRLHEELRFELQYPTIGAAIAAWQNRTGASGA